MGFLKHKGGTMNCVVKVLRSHKYHCTLGLTMIHLMTNDVVKDLGHEMNVTTFVHNVNSCFLAIGK